MLTECALQRALLDTFHVFHFIGHGGFDETAGEGVLVLEHPDGTAHRVGASRLGTLLHDASMQLAVLNACEGARTSGRDAFSGVAQALVRQGLPAVVAMQTEISDKAALVFSHEFYYFLTRGLPIDAAICEVRKAMATSDEVSEWGTAVLVRSDRTSPSTCPRSVPWPARPRRTVGVYAAATSALASSSPQAAVPILERIALSARTTRTSHSCSSGSRPSPEGGRAGRRDVQTDVQMCPHGSSGSVRAGTRGTRTGNRRAAAGSRARWEAREQARRERQQRDLDRREQDGGRSSGSSRRRRPTRVLKLVVWAALLAVALLAWRFLPSLLQRAEPIVAIACGSPSQSSPPDSTFLVGCAPVAPVVDGEFDDWRSVTSHPVTAVVDERGGLRDGLSGSFRLLWDKDALFVHAAVTDAEITPVGHPARAVSGPATASRSSSARTRAPSTPRTRFVRVRTST